MDNNTRIGVALGGAALLGALWLAFRYVPEPPEPPAPPVAIEPPAPELKPVPPPAADDSEPSPEPVPAGNAPLPAAGPLPAVACIPRGDMAILQMPEIRAEVDRLAPVAFFGSDFAVYRGLDLATIESFAVQGDSAAMALAGILHYMRTTGMDEDAVQEALTSGLRTLPEGPAGLQPSPRREDVDIDFHLESARDWLWQSVVNGRILSLAVLSAIDRNRGETPVTLGLIDEETLSEIQAESGPQRTSLNEIYRDATTMLAPELATGISAQFYDREPRSDLSRRLAETLADKILNEAAAAGASIPVITPGLITSEEIESRLCARPQR